MKGVALEIKGNWAQFRKAETNKNPLSHDFMTKTALIGMIGAVLGIERQNMKPLFPKLSEGLLYGLQVCNVVKKQSWGFTFRNVSDAWKKSPQQMEFIKTPVYKIIIGLKDKKCLSEFEKFVDFVKKGKACYTPVLGLHNCPAELTFIEEGNLVEKSGSFETFGFVTDDYTPEMSDLSEFRIGFDKIPTFQDDDFWNLPEYFKPVVYPSNQSTLKVSGKYYEFNNISKWCLI